MALRAPGNVVRYLYGDHLGSTVTTLDAGGSSLQRYFPFGAQRGAGEVATAYRYTGQAWEGAVGLYDYGARWYDPALGRFIQPDTIVPEPGNPQSLNRYAYVLNNSLKYTDPTGHAREAGGGGKKKVPPPPPQPIWKKRVPIRLVRNYSLLYGVPWQVAAGLLESEIRLDTELRDIAEDAFFLGLGGMRATGGFLSSTSLGLSQLYFGVRGATPGPGIGNVHTDTAAAVSRHFADNYGSASDMQLGLHDRSPHDVACLLTADDLSVRTVVAYTRLLADYRFGTDGDPSLNDHSNLSEWTMTDAVAVWHTYRYGLHGVSPHGQGFGMNQFQDRSLSLDMSINVAGGPNKGSSMYGSVRYFGYYFGQ